MTPARDSSDTIFEVNVRFPVTFTVVVSAIVLALTVLFYNVTGSLRETVIFLAAASAAGGTIVTAYFIARTLNLYLAQEGRIRGRETALDEQGKKERALRFAERWNDPTLYHVREVCRQIMEYRGKPEDELTRFIEGKKTNVIHVLNLLEEIAFAIEYDLIDLKLIRDQFEGIVVSVWQILEPWVNKHRIARGRPKLWIKVEELAGTWM